MIIIMIMIMLMLIISSVIMYYNIHFVLLELVLLLLLVLVLLVLPDCTVPRLLFMHRAGLRVSPRCFGRVSVSQSHPGDVRPDLRHGPSAVPGIRRKST